MKLYRTRSGILAEHNGQFHTIDSPSWDELVVREDLLRFLMQQCEQRQALGVSVPDNLLPPIGSQEVWAAGVTYFRSRDARMEESKSAGGGDFYDRASRADPPELFFKATAHRVSAPGAAVRIRRDSKWNVPEPELALLIAS